METTASSTTLDFAIKEARIIPGAAIHVHWGLPDPAHIEPDEARRAAFRTTFAVLADRIDAFLSLPIETMEPDAIGRALQDLAG